MKKILLFLLIGHTVFAQQMINETFEFEGNTRYHRIILPDSFAANMPLVLNLHGYTSNGWQQMTYTGMNETADSNEFVLVYPNGLYDSYMMQFWDSSVDYEEVNDVGYISALIDSMAANYQIDESRVYVCGMSNGGAMSHQLACSLSDKVTAIASITGIMNTAMYDTCYPSRAIPVLQMHGTDDVVFPYYGMVNNWLMGTTLPVDGVMAHWVWENFCWSMDSTNLPDVDPLDLSTITKYRYYNCTDNAEVELYKIHGAGHAWPNGIQLPWQPLTNRDINTNQVIWDFFKQFSLPGNSTATDEHYETALSITPNPSDIETTIAHPSIMKHIRLLDLNGRVVLDKRINSSTHTIQTTPFSKGMYVVEIHTKTEVIREKLIVQ